MEDILFRRNKALPHQKSLSSVILAADSFLCEGSLLTALPAKPPLKGEVPAAGGRRGSSPSAAKVAAALSAAVTTTYLQEPAPTLHGREPPKEELSLFPATLRERGVWGEWRFS